MQYEAECTGLVVIRTSPEHVTAAHCPGHGKCPDVPDQLLCCLSCGGNVICCVQRRRPAAACRPEGVEVLRSHHLLRCAEPSVAATCSGRLSARGWWLDLPWRMLWTARESRWEQRSGRVAGQQRRRKILLRAASRQVILRSDPSKKLACVVLVGGRRRVTVIGKWVVIAGNFVSAVGAIIRAGGV